MEAIQNRELLERIFGKWPSFHDAEIHSVLLTRDCELPPQIDVAIHLWQMTNEIDSKGYSVSKNHTLTTMRFIQASDICLEEFNQQNVISDLEISENKDEKGELLFSVFFRGIFGCGALFKCKKIKILSAAPFSESTV
jgi:immunity protein 50 of polymorphic toxin system